MEGHPDRIVRNITESIMSNIRENVEIELSAHDYNRIYESVQDGVKVAVDSGEGRALSKMGK